MSKNAMLNEKKLDEQIAEFADQILATDEDIDMKNFDQADELINLQKTILSMKAAVEIARPDKTTRARIRRNLILLTSQEENPAPQAARQKLRRISGIALASGFALIIFLGIVLMPFQESNPPLTGAAQLSQPWIPILVILGVVTIVIISWLNRQR
ncbi:MAG: hypothetical protein RBS68_00515 [Anaerolineales bacterium]|jgi:hypothetical protein|nr:hypothetical protein [Anaerolineales bacterium]